MKHAVLNTTTLLFVLAILASGCASNSPSFGNSVQAEGKVVSSIGKKWEKGQAMIKKGNKLVRKGNDQIADGEEDIADGNAMVTTGEKLVEEAEKAYKSLNISAPSQ